MLRDLVFSFDCDDGQDEKVFIFAKQLIGSMLGSVVADIFSKHTDACECRFYIAAAEACWNKMCEAAKNEQ